MSKGCYTLCLSIKDKTKVFWTQYINIGRPKNNLNNLICNYICDCFITVIKANDVHF
jgi:hypothetical protein